MESSTGWGTSRTLQRIVASPNSCRRITGFRWLGCAWKRAKNSPRTCTLCPSMILIVEGNARTTGDKHAVMNAGDALLVPQRQPHGFVSLAPRTASGALSINSISRGLYGDIENPWATFLADDKIDRRSQENPVEQLFKKNDEYMERFDKHQLFVLVAANGLLNNPQSAPEISRLFPSVVEPFPENGFRTALCAAKSTLFEELAWAPFDRRARAQSGPR